MSPAEQVLIRMNDEVARTQVQGEDLKKAILEYRRWWMGAAA